MPEPHGRSLTNWLRRYRAGEGGAKTPPLGDVLVPTVLVDDVRQVIPPLPVSQVAFRQFSGGFAGQRAGVEVVAGRAGSIVLGVEAENNGFLALYNNGVLLANNRGGPFSPNPNVVGGGPTTGGSQFTVFEGTETIGNIDIAVSVVGGPGAYELDANVLYAVPLFLAPGDRVVAYGNTDGANHTVNFTVQDYPVT